MARNKDVSYRHETEVAGLFTEEEAWRVIPGWETYQASSLGRVRGPRGILSPFPNRDGYLQVNLSRTRRRKRFYVHRLVLLAFVGRADGLVCHRNDVRTDNRLENLYWGNYQTNYRDSVRNGNQNPVGEGHPQAKLTRKKIETAISEHAKGVSWEALGRRFGVTGSCVRQAATGTRWKHLHA